MGKSIKENYKKFGTTVAKIALILASLSDSASAATLTSNFTVDIIDGPLIGNQYYGSLSFDDSSLTGSGFEFVTPSANSLLVNFTFINSSMLPQIYTQSDDIGYPTFPRAEFQDGSFLGLNHYIDSSPILISFDGGSFDYSVDFESFIGSVVYSTPAPVPLEFNPVSGLLILLAVSGVRKVVNKKKNSNKGKF